MRLVVISLLSAISITISVSAQAQCTRDTDCKGDRICQSGSCVDPGGNAGGVNQTATQNVNVNVVIDGQGRMTPSGGGARPPQPLYESTFSGSPRARYGGWSAVLTSRDLPGLRECSGQSESIEVTGPTTCCPGGAGVFINFKGCDSKDSISIAAGPYEIPVRERSRLSGLEGQVFVRQAFGYKFVVVITGVTLDDSSCYRGTGYNQCYIDNITMKFLVFDRSVNILGR